MSFMTLKMAHAVRITTSKSIEPSSTIGVCALGADVSNDCGACGELGRRRNALRLLLYNYVDVFIKITSKK
jgi:hypothetical protein